MRISLFVPMVSATFVVAGIALGMNSPAPAGDACIERPNQQPTEGTHWYYRFDGVQKRKCWYLGTIGARTLAAETPQAQSDSIPTPTFSSLFFSLFEGRAATTTVPQDTTMREPRIIQANPTKLLRIDDVVQKERPSIPEERAEPRYEPPLKRAQRNALFQKFLQWDENMRITGGGPPIRSP